MEPERLRNSDDRRIGGVAVAGLEIKNVGEPDETRPFVGKGQAAVVNVAWQLSVPAGGGRST